MKAFLVPLLRFINNFSRSSRKENLHRLKNRNENIKDSFVFRDAHASDIQALAQLHVATWNDTYPRVRKPPTYEVREWQWKDYFSKPNEDSFVILIERRSGGLVGFARGVELKNKRGDLNKIYLLRDYQRLGLGTALLHQVSLRFQSMGVDSLQVIAEAENPSCWFYEKMGGKKMRNSDGSINHGNYLWTDINFLISRCSAPG